MADQVEWIPLSVFIFFFALVTVMGFLAARWKTGDVSAHLDEWGASCDGHWSILLPFTRCAGG